MLDNLIPCRDKHAVKEATITVFLDKPLEDIESFKQIFDTELHQEFKRFETLSTKQLSLTVSSDQEPNVSQVDLNATGFKMINYEEGKPSQIFQGINEHHRTYFSFHELNYVRWENFKEFFDKCISAVANRTEYRVKAYSLHFLDEFLWNNSNEIPYDEIFQKNNPILPNIFYGGRTVDFLIARDMKDEGQSWSNLMERIQINGFHSGIETGSKITLSHNLSEVIKEEDVSELIQSSEFGDKINYVHGTNKGLLNALFVDEIKERIKLNG